MLNNCLKEEFLKGGIRENDMEKIKKNLQNFFLSNVQPILKGVLNIMNGRKVQGIVCQIL